jgi:predicted DNA-binding protein with PD1-like motif
MRTVVVRLRPGQDLERELLAVAERERIQAGWVLTCVGSLSRATLRLAGASRRRTTAEVVLGADDRLRFDREHDPETGYRELVVHPQEQPS